MGYLAGMTKPRVYVETTIPSFYHEERTAPTIVARREWTQLWWESAPERYDLVTSPAELDELAGAYRSAARNDWLWFVIYYSCPSSRLSRKLSKRTSGTSSCRLILVVTRCTWHLRPITSATFW